jgi:hypothetical protein
MLLTLALLLLVIALVGGVAVHPLMFAIIVLALVVFMSGRRGSVA